jgi:hypothetical protein
MRKFSLTRIQLRAGSENVLGAYYLSRERIRTPKEPDTSRVITHCVELVGIQIEPFYPCA